MRWLALVLTMWLSAPAQADMAPDPAIEGTIRGQVERFLADDFAGAFAFASPGIQGMFGSPERFGAMVRNGYPMVWRPEDLRFLELREIGGRIWQKVLIRDQAGNLHVLDYQMLPGPDGWRIDGVQLLKAPGVGA